MENKNKAPTLLDSDSSDDGVDDPGPMERPQSDTDHEISTTTNDVTKASTNLEQSLADTTRYGFIVNNKHF